MRAYQLEIFAICLLATTSAQAADFECNLGSPDILQLIDWQIAADPADPAAATLSLRYHNVSGKPIVDVFTYIHVDDLEGNRLAWLNLQPSADLAPDEVAEETVTHTGTGLEAVLGMEHDAVVITLCTNTVEFADGSGTIFD